MNIITHFEKNISLPIIFLHSNLDISNYVESLIKDIEEGFKDSQKHYETNVKGKMTEYTYFNKHILVNSILSKQLNYLQHTLKVIPTILPNECWGIRTDFRDKTVPHDHRGARYSSILYLNDSDQKTYFPEINFSIKPSKGDFLFFSAILNHATDFNTSNIPKYAIATNYLLV